MTRRRNTQLALSEIVLATALGKPEDLMDPILRFIDAALDDETLVDHVHDALRRRHAQSARRGRHGTPAEVVLRLQVLKHLKGWAFEQLEWEVRGNVAYRHFCRIHTGKVPDSTTMVRHGQLLHGSALWSIFDRIVQQARERHVTAGRRMRIDTTVVEAPIHYPTDSALCEDSVRVLRRTMSRLVDAGVKLSFKLRHVGRSVARRMREIGQALRLRGEAAKEAIKKPYRRLLRITARLVRQAEAAIEQAATQMTKIKTSARARVARALDVLREMAPRARRVVQQTRARIVRGVTNSKTKLISIFEPHAQILRRGKLHRPTEFGQMVKVQEADGGIVTDIGLSGRNDAPLLIPAVERHIEVFGRAPQLAATDRGFYSGKGEFRIRELGVKRPVIPKPGHKSKKRVAYERQRWFKRGRAWRAGGEARISRLKHRFGMARSRYKGEQGTKRTALWAGIANNLVAIGTKMASGS